MQIFFVGFPSVQLCSSFIGIRRQFTLHLFFSVFPLTIAIQEVRHCSAIPLILPLPGQEENLLTLIASARPWTMCSQLYHSQPSENPSIIFYIVLYNRRNLNGIITCTIYATLQTHIIGTDKQHKQQKQYRQYTLQQMNFQ